MKTIIVKILCKSSNLFLVSLPLLYGCGGGGGGGASVGSLFSPATSPGIGTTHLASALVAVPSGIATVHNPEPATMFLLGGGMLAMGFVKSRMRSMYS